MHLDTVDNMDEPFDWDKVEDYMLEDIVHDLSASIAAEINNSGVKQQRDYLISNGYPEKEIIAHLAAYFEDD